MEAARSSEPLPLDAVPHERLQLYVPGEVVDLALVLWWHRLNELRELDLTFGTGSRALSAFLGNFTREGHRLLYALDEQDRIACAMLVVPAMQTAFLTVWLSPEWRRCRLGLEVLESAYETVLQHVPVLLGITRQPRLLPVHARWGYTRLGMIPGVFDGHDGHLVLLTADAYYTAKARGRRRG